MNKRKDILGKAEKIVIKIGTSSISNENGGLEYEFMDKIASQISRLHQMGKQVIIVSSGSIGIGIDILHLDKRPREIPVRQAAAAVGQSILMQEWIKAFSKYDLNVAQILLTYSAFSDRLTYLNLRNSISTLLGYGVIPIINENDIIKAYFSPDGKKTAFFRPGGEYIGNWYSGGSSLESYSSILSFFFFLGTGE